jgi:hypothetical protein
VRFPRSHAGQQKGRIGGLRLPSFAENRRWILVFAPARKRTSVSCPPSCSCRVPLPGRILP